MSATNPDSETRPPVPSLLRITLRVPLLLDVNALVKGGWLAPGLRYVWAWGEPLIASVYVQTSENCLSLSYRQGSAETLHQECILLERAECYFGGTRPRFVCASCDKGYYRLFLQNGLFRCRACHNLRHSKQVPPPEERAALTAEQTGYVIMDIPAAMPTFAPLWAAIPPSGIPETLCGNAGALRVLHSSMAEKVSARNPAYLGKNGRPLIPILSKPCTCGRGDALEGHRYSCPRGQLIHQRQRLGKPLV